MPSESDVDTMFSKAYPVTSPKTPPVVPSMSSRLNQSLGPSGVTPPNPETQDIQNLLKSGQIGYTSPGKSVGPSILANGTPVDYHTPSPITPSAVLDAYRRYAASANVPDAQGVRGGTFYPTIGGAMSGEEVPANIGALEHLSMLIPAAGANFAGGLAGKTIAGSALGRAAEGVGAKALAARFASGVGQVGAGLGGGMVGGIGENTINTAIQGPELSARIAAGKEAFRRANPAAAVAVENLPMLGLGAGLPENFGQGALGFGLGASNEGVEQIKSGKFEPLSILASGAAGMIAKSNELGSVFHNAGESAAGGIGRGVDAARAWDNSVMQKGIDSLQGRGPLGDFLYKRYTDPVTPPTASGKTEVGRRLTSRNLQSRTALIPKAATPEQVAQVSNQTFRSIADEATARAQAIGDGNQLVVPPAAQIPPVVPLVEPLPANTFAVGQGIDNPDTVIPPSVTAKPKGRGKKQPVVSEPLINQPVAPPENNQTISSAEGTQTPSQVEGDQPAASLPYHAQPVSAFGQQGERDAAVSRLEKIYGKGITGKVDAFRRIANGETLTVGDVRHVADELSSVRNSKAKTELLAQLDRIAPRDQPKQPQPEQVAPSAEESPLSPEQTAPQAEQVPAATPEDNPVLAPLHTERTKKTVSADEAEYLKGKLNPRTGLTAKQTDHLAEALHPLALENEAVEYPATIPVPSDGKFTVQDPKQARGLYREVTGSNPTMPNGQPMPDVLMPPKRGVAESGVDNAPYRPIPERGFDTFGDHAGMSRQSTDTRVQEAINAYGSITKALRAIDNQITDLQAGKGNKDGIKQREQLREAIEKHQRMAENTTRNQVENELSQEFDNSQERTKLLSEIDPEDKISQRDKAYADANAIRDNSDYKYLRNMPGSKLKVAERSRFQQLNNRMWEHDRNASALNTETKPIQAQIDKAKEAYTASRIEPRVQDRLIENGLVDAPTASELGPKADAAKARIDARNAKTKGSDTAQINLKNSHNASTAEVMNQMGAEDVQEAERRQAEAFPPSVYSEQRPGTITQPDSILARRAEAQARLNRRGNAGLPKDSEGFYHLPDGNVLVMPSQLTENVTHLPEGTSVRVIRPNPESGVPESFAGSVLTNGRVLRDSAYESVEGKSYWEQGLSPSERSVIAMREGVHPNEALATVARGRAFVLDALNNEASLSSKERSAAIDFLNYLPEKYFADLGIHFRDSTRPLNGNAPAEYSFATAIADMVRYGAKRAKGSEIIAPHEFAHHLENFLTNTDRTVLTRQYESESASTERTQHPSLPNGYKYSSFREWFAETMREKAFRDIDKQNRTLWQKIKDIAFGIANWLKSGGKTDAASSIYKQFVDGKIDTVGKTVFDRAALKSGKQESASIKLSEDNHEENLPDYAIIGAAHLARGVRSSAEFVSKMVEQFGEGIRPHLTAIERQARSIYSKALLNDTDEQLANHPLTLPERGAKEPMPTQETPTGVKPEATATTPKETGQTTKTEVPPPVKLTTEQERAGSQSFARDLEIAGGSRVRMADIEEMGRQTGIDIPDKATFKQSWSDIEQRANANRDEILLKLAKIDPRTYRNATPEERTIAIEQAIKNQVKKAQIADAIDALPKTATQGDKDALLAQYDEANAEAERFGTIAYKGNSDAARAFNFSKMVKRGPFDAADLVAQAKTLARGKLRADTERRVTQQAVRAEQEQAKADAVIDQRSENNTRQRTTRSKPASTREPKVYAQGDMQDALTRLKGLDLKALSKPLESTVCG